VKGTPFFKIKSIWAEEKVFQLGGEVCGNDLGGKGGKWRVGGI